MKQRTATTWLNQDSLPLTKEEWLSLLARKDILDENIRTMLYYVYSQANHQASATAIAAYFTKKESQHITQQKITSINRKAAKAIYNLYCKAPPANESKGCRYWNVLFDCAPERPVDQFGHFLWRIRPTLIEAIDEWNQQGT